MLFFKLLDGKVTQVSEDCYPKDERGQWVARHDMKAFYDACGIAMQATEVTGELYIGVDSGDNVWPRYDVIKAPKLGDAVSYSFNGDSYPDGEIVHVTPGTLRQIKTSTGSTYYRRKLSAGWRKQGGTWWMIRGHHNHRNPSF